MKFINLKLLLFVSAIILFGCVPKTSNQNILKGNVMTDNQPNFNESKIAKVKVTQTSKIFLNEKQVSLGELKEAFARLKQEDSGVWYYRENPQSEPSAEATSVVQAIIDAKLPVQLSSKPDFSDSIDMEGKSNPKH